MFFLNNRQKKQLRKARRLYLAFLRYRVDLFIVTTRIFNNT